MSEITRLLRYEMPENSSDGLKASYNLGNVLKLLKIRNDPSIEIKHKYIADGVSSDVYSVEIGTQKYALKMMTNNVRNDNDMCNVNTLITSMVHEIEYAYAMSHKEIGPTLYETFFMYNKGLLVGGILMEYYDTDISNICTLKSNIKSMVSVYQITIDLMYKQIFEENIYCTDIKPENFVIKINKANDVKMNDVKMIDFDPEFCSSEFDEKYMSKNLFFMVVLIQLYLLAKSDCVTNFSCLNPFLSYIKYLIEHKLGDLDLADYLRSVLEETKSSYVHMHYFKHVLPLSPDDSPREKWVANRIAEIIMSDIENI
jgi:hypothetical protein